MPPFAASRSGSIPGSTSPLAERAAGPASRGTTAGGRNCDRSLHGVRGHRQGRVIQHPEALVLATDLDQLAVACATANGVAVSRGDLFDPLPSSLEGVVDVVVSVVPYVPTPELAFLPHDTLAFESSLSYDGGPDGMSLLRRVAAGARRFLRPGGHSCSNWAVSRPANSPPTWLASPTSTSSCSSMRTGTPAASKRRPGPLTDGRAPPVIGRVKCGS